jgi:hypothetical protein
MEAKSKAIELRDKHAKFQTYTVGFEVDTHSEFVRLQRAKQSALITVEEILEAQPSYRYWETYNDETPSAITFWNEVKAELEALT